MQDHRSKAASKTGPMWRRVASVWPPGGALEFKGYHRLAAA